MRRSFPLTLCLFAAAGLLGCALDAHAPGDPAEGEQSATSELTSGGAVTGAATPAARAVLSILGGGGAPPFDFGGAVVGSSVVRALTVTNTGTAASAALSTVAISGATDFTLVTGASPCAGMKLATGKSCTVVVVYTPTALGHADAATLTVSDGSVKATAALAGLGIATGVDYVVSPDPGNLALSPGQSGHLTFTVTNAGTAAGPAIARIGTDGDGGYSWFHIASDGCSGSPGLGVLASCTFQVDVTVPAAPSQKTSTYYLAVAGAGVVAPGNATAAYSKAIVTVP